MKRNWSKKALSLLMAGTMMAGLAGCGSDAAQNDSSAAASAAQSSAHRVRMRVPATTRCVPILWIPSRLYCSVRNLPVCSS